MAIKTKYKVGDKVQFNMELISQLFGYEGEVTRIYSEKGYSDTYYIKFELEYDIPEEYIIKKVRRKRSGSI